MYYPQPYVGTHRFYEVDKLVNRKLVILAFLILFLLISAYLESKVMPEFQLANVKCSRNYVVAELSVTKGGRLSDVSAFLQLSGVTYMQKISGYFRKGSKATLVYETRLKPGSYEGKISILGKEIGNFTCKVV